MAGTPAMMEFGWNAGGTPGMMEFAISGGGWNTHEIPELRRFDNVDLLTGTPEPDNFKLEPPGFKTQRYRGEFFSYHTSGLDIDFANNLIAYVYQESDDSNYWHGFTAPTERFYTIIENFNPLEDEIQILVDGGKGHVKIMSDENDIPMLTDDIQPASRIFGL